MLHTMPVRVSQTKFDALVEQAITQLPPQFAEALSEIPVQVVDRPTPQQLQSLGLRDDQLLLGLYVGIPLPERSVQLSGNLPDVIYLFREDLENACDSEADLVEQVRITVFHELGHYFGMDEDDLDAAGYA